jgi:hypothetical protein
MSRRTVVAIACCSCLAFASIGYAATFTLTTKKLGAAMVTTPIMFPDQIIIANKAGQTLGRADNGDTVTFVYSRQLNEPTLCSGWLNSDPTPAAVKLTWSIINGTGGANDTLAVTAVPATCASGFPIGSVDLGSGGYNTSTSADIDFPSNTVLTVGATTSTIVVTLGGRKGGTQGTVGSGNAATWTPNSAVTDLSGNNCGANLSKTSSTIQF